MPFCHHTECDTRGVPLEKWGRGGVREWGTTGASWWVCRMQGEAYEAGDSVLSPQTTEAQGVLVVGGGVPLLKEKCPPRWSYIHGAVGNC